MAENTDGLLRIHTIWANEYYLDNIVYLLDKLCKCENELCNPPNSLRPTIEFLLSKLREACDEVNQLTLGVLGIVIKRFHYTFPLSLIIITSGEFNGANSDNK